MIRRTLRLGLLLGLLGGVAFALARLLGQQSSDRLALPRGSTEPWPRLSSDPSTAAPAIDHLVPDPVAPAKRWVEPTGSVCPTSHPVKAKLSSKIFHLPGMANYERTTPDRCYADPDGAVADGLRPAKR